MSGSAVMRFIVTVVLALVASILAAAAAATAIAQWTRAGQEYVLVYMAIAPAAVIAAAIFLFASAGQMAFTKTARALIGFVAVMFVITLVLSLVGSASIASVWDEAKLTGAIALSCVTVVAVQWAIFRWRLVAPYS